MAGSGSDLRAADRACIIWLSGGSCEGCTMSVLGATAPRLEELLSGNLTHIPTIDLVHPALALHAGDSYLRELERARDTSRGPFLVVVEGSIPTEPETGFFSRLGDRDGVPRSVRDWLLELAPEAAAVVALGTCATSGGIPAGQGGVTGATGVGAVLGAGFRTRAGLPVVNVPGCAASGDGFIEVISYVLLHLGGIVPLDLDEEGRPRWLYADTTSVTTHPGGLEASCPVPRRGWINRLGGCVAVGGECVGCTRPDFPDLVSSAAPND